MAARPKVKQLGGGLLVSDPAGKADSAVIFMHGLGDSSRGWIDGVMQVFAPELPGTRFILPTAPSMPVTLNGGFKMPAWYDIESLSGDRTLEQCKGIQESMATVRGLIAEQVAAGVPENKIALAGFSQGGAMSYFVGLNHPTTLGGLLVLSGYMPLPGSIKPTAAALATPVMQLHGDEDGVVPLAYGEDAYKRAKAMGVKSVTWKVYEGLEHSANLEELADAAAFLKARLQ